ncbi:MAG TPA: LysM peptidoglycan-binding domain-containing protein, partial [Anaerolineales bacterium]|nr:LysM peptidoglycan-binding domain-containing protein [Anaerolineales bacterium]
IAAGRPVIVWVIGQMWPGNSHTYTDANGQSVQVAPFEHTMILIGYTPKRVQVVDAYSGQTQNYPLQVFLHSWSVLGNMAITAQPAAEPAQPAAESPKPAAAETQPAVVAAALPGETPAPAFGQAETAPVDTISQPYIQRLLMIFKDAYPLGGAPALETPTKPAVYIVQRGEGLIDIGRRLNVDWRMLAQLNGLTPPYWLRPGQALTLP